MFLVVFLGGLAPTPDAPNFSWEAAAPQTPRFSLKTGLFFVWEVWKGGTPSKKKGGLGGSGPPGKHKSEQAPRAIKDFETVHRHFHTLPPVGHGSTTNRSPAGRQPASLLVSQAATCHLSVTCWQTASQATMLTSKQAVSQASQPASQPVSQPNNQTICQPICVIV